MAFLVAGTLQAASQMADVRGSLERKGKYSVQGLRVALTLSSPEVSASTVAVLDGVFRALGFESCRRREASVQGFLGELAGFREQLDAHRGPVGCVLVAVVAPRGQLRQPRQLVRELSCCGALRGCPKVFLLLSSTPGAAPEPGAFLTGLGELCGRSPHWPLLQLLTEVGTPPGEFWGGGCTGHLPWLCCALLNWAGDPERLVAVSLTKPSLEPKSCPHGAALRGPLAPSSPGLLQNGRRDLRGHLLPSPAELPAGRTVPGGHGALGARGKCSWARPEPGPSAQYDLSGARAALLLAVIQGRPGAQHDVEAVGGLCQALGFETTLRTDPPAQAFLEELTQFREWLDAHRGPVSCALVALMAHGGPQGQLLAVDGQEVWPEVLVQELSGCRALRGCPKVFLLQACRGGHRDPGTGPTLLPWFQRWLWVPPATSSHADVLQIYADAQGGICSGPTPGSCDQADILTVYAAAEGCVAYRDERGSDFIQTLVEVLRAEPQGDLLELLTEVNRQVCELNMLGPDSEEQRKACLEIRSSLRRRLCLQA
ncbi:hypothetical protein MC885_004795 [Smutsia gigantea]|nr:hypothetical protein MC885_004795 [Smutsia gigantea]